ncbi:hypothetical protein STEG23_021249, partial [Scotinomys teguina]
EVCNQTFPKGPLVKIQPHIIGTGVRSVGNKRRQKNGIEEQIQHKEASHTYWGLRKSPIAPKQCPVRHKAHEFKYPSPDICDNVDKGKVSCFQADFQLKAKDDLDDLILTVLTYRVTGLQACISIPSLCGSEANVYRKPEGEYQSR